MVIKRSLRAPKNPLRQEHQEGPPSVTPQDLTCPLCKRTMIPGPTIDEHHLIPRSQGGKEKYLIHKICHRKIHRVFTEKQLKQMFYTWEQLQAHPDIAVFIEWVKKRPPEYCEN